MKGKNQITVFAHELPERGQPLAGGVFIQRYWVGSEERALVLLDAKCDFEGKWGDSEQEIETCWTDGLANTKAMAEAGNEIAKKALELGGHIPSCLEASLLMAAKHEGLITLREDRWHWLSTQSIAHGAYGMDFANGWQDGDDESHKRIVRPVRSLIIR